MFNKSWQPTPIEIVGRHLQVTEAMKDYARKKIAKIEQFQQPVIALQIAMDVQKQQHRVDALLFLQHLQVKVHVSSNDMYLSIDRAAHRLVAKLLKWRKRIHHLQRRKLSSTEPAIEVVQEILL